MIKSSSLIISIGQTQLYLIFYSTSLLTNKKLSTFYRFPPSVNISINNVPLSISNRPKADKRTPIWLEFYAVNQQVDINYL